MNSEQRCDGRENCDETERVLTAERDRHKARAEKAEAENARLRKELGELHDEAEKLARRCIRAARGPR